MNVKRKPVVRLVPAPDPAGCTGCFYLNKPRSAYGSCMVRANSCSGTARYMIFKEVKTNGN